MCCNLRTHVIVISIICLVFTGLGSLELIGSVTAVISAQVTREANLIYGGSNELALGIHILLFATWLVAEILCLIGALKNKKFFLIPFIIVQCLTIVAIVVFVTFFIIMAHKTSADATHESYAAIFFYILVIPLLVVLGLTIYFLTITIKFFQELSSGVVGGRTEGVVLQPYASPTQFQAGSGPSTVYVPSGAQNVTYAYQQQPPSYAQIQQGYVYPANNPGMKHPA